MFRRKRKPFRAVWSDGTTGPIKVGQVGTVYDADDGTQFKEGAFVFCPDEDNDIGGVYCGDDAFQRVEQ